jgi:hypothetical protein
MEAPMNRSRETDRSARRRAPDASPLRTAGLAQLVEHVICNHGVGGSNPSAGTSKINGLDDKSLSISDNGSPWALTGYSANA